MVFLWCCSKRWACDVNPLHREDTNGPIWWCSGHGLHITLFVWLLCLFSSVHLVVTNATVTATFWLNPFCLGIACLSIGWNGLKVPGIVKKPSSKNQKVYFVGWKKQLANTFGTLFTFWRLQTADASGPVFGLRVGLNEAWNSRCSWVKCLLIFSLCG